MKRRLTISIDSSTTRAFTRAFATIDAVLAATLLPSVALAVGSNPPPNILVIVADDLGYGDVGFHGGKEIPTPNLDSIAANGVQFTNGYVTCPVCSPTRAGIATGRYQQRFGHEFNPGGVNHKDGNDIGLPLNESTLAEALRDAGYRTAAIGKWHLGDDTKRHPLRRGFDQFYGFLGGAHPYVPSGKGAKGGGPIYRNDSQVDAPAHLTAAFAEEAAKYIAQDSEHPFFVYLTFNAVHNPLQPDEEHLARFASISDPQRRSYAALLSGLDDGIGTVLNALKDSDKLDSTLVFFISDNGGPQARNGSNNSPLSGDKGSVYEGGIRVPFLMQWKGTLPAGEKFDAPVISLDIPATAAAAANAKLGNSKKPIDGVNLLPYVSGDAQGPPHESLFWRFGVQHAIRQGEYKLRQQGNEPPQLFNLATDVGEKNDLASEHPEIVDKLKAAYAEWNSELAKPLWKTGKAAGKKKARADRRSASQTSGERNRKQKTAAN